MSGPVEEHHRGAVGAQSRERDLQSARHIVWIGAGADDVVAARGDGDEVGAQLERRLDLLVDDLLQQAATDGEIGVGEILGARAQHLGDTVGPASVTAWTARFRVTDSLREGVPDRDIA